MKILILLLIAVAFAACTKPVDTIQTTEKKVFYRIKQVDLDGKETYSPTVYVVEKIKK